MITLFNGMVHLLLLVCKVGSVRRSLFTLLLDVFSRLYSVIVTHHENMPI